MITKKGKVWYDTNEIMRLVKLSDTTRAAFIVKMNLLWNALSDSDKKQYKKNMASKVLQEYLCNNHKSAEVLET